MDLETSNNAEGNITDKQKRQLKCINRRCVHGDTLISAIQIVCTYYHIEYKPGKMVCKTCFTKSLKHFRLLKKKLKNKECIMIGEFPNYESHYVIESSEDESDEPQSNTSKKQQPRPSLKVLAGLDISMKLYFKENKDLIDEQLRICDDYIDERLEDITREADDIDDIIDDISNEVTSLKSAIYEPYKPHVIYLPTLDLDESGNEIEDVVDKKPTIVDKKPTIVDKKSTIVDNDTLDTDTVNRIIFGNKEELSTENTIDKEEDELDKEDIITVDSTICTVPADLPRKGSLVYNRIYTGLVVYGMKTTLMDPWFKCKITTVINDDYVHVDFGPGEKLLTRKEFAYRTPSPVRFTVGSRVIAKFSVPGSKGFEYFYAGIIAEAPKLLNEFRYLIFYDDGFVQYRYHKDIRLIVHKSEEVWNDVNTESSDFIKSYITNFPERHMVKLIKKHTIRASYKNQWQTAKVIDVDASLVKLYFPDLKRTEWLYRGSSRLWNIFEKQSQSEKGIRSRNSGLAYLNKPFVEYTSIEEDPHVLNPSVKSVARKSTSKGSTLQTDATTEQKTTQNEDYRTIKLKLPDNIMFPKLYLPHKCKPSCIDWTEYDYSKTKRVNVLSIPLYFGFRRAVVTFNKELKNVMYKTPCGRTVRSMDEMYEYLVLTNSKMTIDLFDFSGWVKIMAEFRVYKSIVSIEDLSMGKEFRKLTCVNNINDKLPPAMEYMTTRKAMPGVNLNVDSNFLCGCDCTDNCRDKSNCACWRLTFEGQEMIPNLYKDPNIGYINRRLPERVLSGIYECNSTCKCSDLCVNRVVQQPLSQKLQLFMTEKKGWGVRCLNDIPQGGFVCIYVGYLLTENDANEGGINYGDEYLAELDYIEVIEKIKEGYESDVSESDQENDSSRTDDKSTISESSDEDFQSTNEGTSRVVSDFVSRLRKRKTPKKDVTAKKDTKVVSNHSKLKVRDIKKKPKPTREYFGENESVYIMDAKSSGNIGRYLNHSCSPNIFVQNVFVDTHDLRFPWVSFFALHYIPAGTELTWDYSYDIGSVPGKVMKCHCDSLMCRGRLL